MPFRYIFQFILNVEGKRLAGNGMMGKCEWGKEKRYTDGLTVGQIYGHCEANQAEAKA